MKGTDQTEYQGKNTKKDWEEIRNKTKSRTIRDDKRERKKYIEQCKGVRTNQNQTTNVEREQELQERGRTTIVPIM